MSRLASREPAAIRVTAPVSLDDLLWVGNTSHGPGAHWHARPAPGDAGHDHLLDAVDARRYLADHGVVVPPDPPDADALAALRVVRDAIRGRLLTGLDPWSPAARELLGTTPFRLEPDGRIAGREPGWPGLVAGLLAGIPALADARAGLRECGNPQCRLVFLDASRNHRRTWCDTAGCGNRSRVRRARARGNPAGRSGGAPGEGRDERRQGVAARDVSRPGTPS